MQVKNFLFDLGGVIIDLHIHKTRDAFEQLGIKDAGNWFVAHEQAELLSSYETGRISTETFIDGLNAQSGLAIPEGQFYQAWTAMLGKIRRERLQLIRELREHHHVYALSNINPMHAHGCHDILQREHDIYSFHEVFDLVFYSHEIGARKPDKEAWEKVVERTGIVPSETVFFDDNMPNVEVARELGFQAHHVDREIGELMARLQMAGK